MPSNTSTALAVSAFLLLFCSLLAGGVPARSENAGAFPEAARCQQPHTGGSCEQTHRSRLEPATATPTPGPLTGVVIYEKPVTIPAYLYEAFLYDSYNAFHHMTVKKLDWNAYEQAAPVLFQKTLTGIILENEYLQLTILPELGGRIYGCVFKPTGHNSFYQNPVLKPTRWGPREQGWWLAAGGMEWDLPVSEHGYESAIPWQFSTAQANEGLTVSVQDSDRDDRLTAQVDIHLPADKAYFTVTPTLNNPTSYTIYCKFWINAMLAPGGTNAPSGRLEFSFPTEQMTVHSRDIRWANLPGPGHAFQWPDLEGRDLSIFGNWPYYMGCFERPFATNDFAGLYDPDVEEGMVRVFPSDIARGAKIFAPGYGKDALPPFLWTDGSSYYIEMHGGIEPTFSDFSRLPAGAMLTWTEYWYPVKDIGGIVRANREAALNLESTESGVWIGVAVTSPRADARVKLKEAAGSTALFEETVPLIDPARPYRAGPILVDSLTIEDLAFSLEDAGGQPILTSD